MYNLIVTYIISIGVRLSVTREIFVWLFRLNTKVIKLSIKALIIKCNKRTQPIHPPFVNISKAEPLNISDSNKVIPLSNKNEFCVLFEQKIHTGFFVQESKAGDFVKSFY